MYICATSKIIHQNKSVAEYKKELKNIIGTNLRRISKFNILALYGAYSCLDAKQYDSQLNIYTGSEYGCFEDMNNVVEKISKEDEFLMPFDFLNVNGNNVGFLISQMLNTQGNNFFITAELFSFEESLKMAYYDLCDNAISEALVGGVDESLQEVKDVNNYIVNVENQYIHDGSSWLHLSKNPSNAIVKIKALHTFNTLEDLNKKLDELNYDGIMLNQLANHYKEKLHINYNKLLSPKDNCFYGTYSAGYLVDLVHENLEKKLFISMDNKNRSIVIELESIR